MILALAWGCTIAGCSGDSTNGGAGGSGGSSAITDGGGETGTVGCLMPAPTVTCPTPPRTYSMVKPIFDARCVGVCHDGKTPDPSMPDMNIWGLEQYSHVKDWEDAIRDQVGNCTMPPVDAGVPMTIEDRQALLEFVKCGAPQ